MKKKEIEYPKNIFGNPPYDKRCSYFIQCGDDYGVGKAQAVGHMGSAKDPEMPKSHCKKVDPRENT